MAKPSLLGNLIDAGEKLIGAVRLDSWRNTLSSVGDRARDKAAAFFFVRPPLLTAQQCLDLFHFDDLANRICSAVPEEALREGFEIVAVQEEGDARDKSDTQKQQKTLKKAVDSLDLAGKVQEAMIWGRTTGGAAIVLLADGAPEEPIAEDAVELRGLEVVDRTSLSVATKYRKGAFRGEPETYWINEDSELNGLRIHESRLILFRGVMTARSEKQRNGGWDHSVLQRVINVLAQTNGAWASVISMMQDLSQAVFKMKGLIDAIASDTEESVQKRLTLMDTVRSITNAVLLDAEDEDFSIVERGAATGLDGLVDKLFLRLSSAARMPVAILLGQSPAGLNATGSIDLRWWYDTVRTAQTIEAKPRIERVVRMMARSLFPGQDPNIWCASFKSLWQMSPTEEATYRKTIADTDNVYVQMGAVIAEEITLSRWGSGVYSADMQIDLETHNAMREKELERAAAQAEEPPAPPPVPPTLPLEGPSGPTGEGPSGPTGENAT